MKEIIKLSLSKNLSKELKRLAKDWGYSSESEFLCKIIKEKLAEEKDILKMILSGGIVLCFISDIITSSSRVSAGRRVRPTHTNLEKILEMSFNIEIWCKS